MAVLATIVVLGVLIFVHELGHFWAAKAVGIEVQRFSIGLGPRVWGFRRGETEYVLSAIPLGGYVKMAGMDDEVMERIEGGPVREEPKKPGEGDFDSKPVWARALVISAGVIMNMLFAFATYSFVAGVWGEGSPDTTRIGRVVAEILPAGTAPLASVEPGSNLVLFGDREIRHWGDVREAVLQDPPGPVRLVFSEPAREVVIEIPDSEEARSNLVRAMDWWREPAFSMVTPGDPADQAGVLPGDRVLTVEGETVTTWDDFTSVIQARPGQETEMTLLRDGREVTVTVTPRAATQVDPSSGEERTVGQIGVLQDLGDIVYTPVGPLDAMRIGWRQTVAVTGMILGFLRDLITGGVPADSVGSIFTIGEASGEAADEGLDMFLSFMALFSINLAILNLLPIPVLDGGHLVFLGIEAVRGRPLSVEQRIRLSQIGFFVIMGIMVWALSNDFRRIFGL